MNAWIKVTPETLPPNGTDVQVACRKSIASTWTQVVAYYDSEFNAWFDSFSDKEIESLIDLYFVFYWRPLFDNPISDIK